MAEENFFANERDQYDVEVKDVGNLALVAGAFDHFGLEELIDLHIGKIGSHVKVNCGAIVKAMVCQLLNVPYQSLNGTSEYYQNKPADVLLGNKGITHEALNRATIARTLDTIYDYGCERLFLQCSAMVAAKMGVKITSAHIDSTSFHYDGVTHEEPKSVIQLLLGYSRDHRPDLNQVITVMLCDELTKIPLIQKTVSGNVNDNKSFYDVVRDHLPLVREQFKDLRYLTGDSALCTGKILADAGMQKIYIVTRVPDKLAFVKDLYENTQISEMEKIDPNDPECLTFGKWCGTQKIDGTTVKLLLINNQALRSQKLHTLEKQAEKELASTVAALKKLSTKPCKCEPDATKAIAELEKKLKFCTLSNIVYTNVEKAPHRGRMKEGETKVVVGVKASADVSINHELIDQALEKSMMFVIATTDLERDWTMADLLRIYRKQSVVETGWKVLKCKKFFVDALYLQLPSRISALMWLITLGLLIFAATEYEVRKVMEQKKLTIPTVDHRRREGRPTLMRLFQYIANTGIHLTMIRKMGSVTISGLTQDLKQILNALGKDWARYFLSNTYSCMLEEDF